MGDRVKLFVLISLGGLTGCASVGPSANLPIEYDVRERAFTWREPISSVRPLADETRLLDSRVIRALLKSSKNQHAVFLDGPQKTAVIIGASLVGVYLISEWIEDELPPPPGP